MALDFSSILKGLTDSDAAATAENPYAGLDTTANNIGSLILKDASTRPAQAYAAGRSYSPWADVAAGGAAGLFSGLFSGLGQNWKDNQNALASTALQNLIKGGSNAELIQPEGMAPSVWHSLQNVNDAMRLQHASHLQDLQDAQAAKNTPLDSATKEIVRKYAPQLGIPLDQVDNLTTEGLSTIRELRGLTDKELTQNKAAQTTVDKMSAALSAADELESLKGQIGKMPGASSGWEPDWLAGAENTVRRNSPFGGQTSAAAEYNSRVKDVADQLAVAFAKQGRSFQIKNFIDEMNQAGTKGPQALADRAEQYKQDLLLGARTLGESSVDVGQGKIQPVLDRINRRMTGAGGAITPDSLGGTQPPPDAVAQARAEGYQIVGQNPQTGKWQVAPLGDTGAGGTSEGDW